MMPAGEIPATRIKNVEAWQRQPCPICDRPLALHLLSWQSVEADWPDGALDVRLRLYCGRP